MVIIALPSVRFSDNHTSYQITQVCVRTTPYTRPKVNCIILCESVAIFYRKKLWCSTKRSSN